MEKKKINILVTRIPIMLPIALISIYQYAISPLFGGNCRCNPTCASYAKDAFIKFGLINGLFCALKRVFRCHPWGSSGYDPVKEESSKNSYNEF